MKVYVVTDYENFYEDGDVCRVLGVFENADAAKSCADQASGAAEIHDCELLAEWPPR